MSEYSILNAGVQLGARVVDLDTGELLARPGREEARALAGRGFPSGGHASASAGGGPSGAGAGAGGLSTAHISTQGDKVAMGKEAAVHAWVGGSLVKAQRTGPYSLAQCGGGKRGKVKSFSRGSRRRLQRLMATIERDKLPIFVTLTYPDEFPGSAQTWAVHLERFRSRLKRKGWGCIWRREFQTRKSGTNVGKVAPHYHLLVWGASYKELKTYLARAWWECCDRICPEHLAAGTRVEVIRTWGGVAGYVSKYMAKTEVLPGLDGVESLGRFWGVINRDAIPWAECIVMTLTDKVVNTLFRYMRRATGIRLRGSCPSFTIFTGDPWRWLCVAEQHWEGENLS